MAKKRKQRYALSRRSRTALIGSALVVAAMLIILDRGLVSRRRSEVNVSRKPMASEDFCRYHRKQFTIVKVLDGDTLEISAPDLGTSTTRIRLLGIDAPEMGSVDLPPMYYAAESTAHTRQLADRVKVTIYLQETGPYRGKYGRLLAYIELPDGTFLNETLVADGHAYADLRFRHNYYQKYKQLESSARSLGMGLWAKATRNDLPPWLQRMQPKLLARD